MAQSTPRSCGMVVTYRTVVWYLSYRSLPTCLQMTWYQPASLLFDLLCYALIVAVAKETKRETHL